MNNSDPFVSIVVPIYNSAQYLEDAIRSVLGQSYAHWELLLVDDGSSDGSREIAARYAGTHPEKVSHFEHPGHEHRGSSATRNLAISHARGTYIALLDADDVWLPEKLGHQVAILESFPEAAMTYGPLQVWHSWRGNSESQQPDCLQDLGGRTGLIRPPDLLALFVTCETATPGTSALMVRSEAVRSVGGFENSFPGLYDDQVLYAKLALEFSIHIETACYSRYRQHPTSMMAVANREQRQQWTGSRLQYLRWLEQYIDERGLDSGGALTMVRRELWRHRHPILYREMRRARRFAMASRRLFELG